MPELCLPAGEQTMSPSSEDIMMIKNKEEEMRSESPKSEASSGLYDVSSASSDAGVGYEEEDDDAGEMSESADNEDATDEMLSREMSQMKLSTEELDTMVTLGADVRHMTQASYKLAAPADKRSSFAGQRVVPGQALRDMAQAQRDAMEQHEKRKSVRPPPGFEKMYGSLPAAGAVADVPELTEEESLVACASSSGPEPVLVSYADGSNTLTLSAEPVCLHNITVASTVDAGHVFIKQMNNPTHAGLAPLEEAMAEAYQQLEAEGQQEQQQTPELLRPIATGSLLAVRSDAKWYRCQVVAYNDAADTCDVKFVDHGGYTTVPVTDLRQLRTDFVRLPFQAIEVYLAHLSPATDEIVVDIVSDILFRDDVSINMVGHAEDGMPVVQAFFYVNDFVHLLTQDVVDDSYAVLRSEFPDYVPVPTRHVTQQQEELSHTTEGQEQQLLAAGTSQEDRECAAYSDWSVEAEEEDEGVWSGVSSNATESEPARSGLNSPVCCGDDTAASTSSTHHHSQQQQQHVLEPGVPLSPAPAPICELVPVPDFVPVLTYCVQDPETGALYYVTAPVVAAPAYYQPVPHQVEQHHVVVNEQPHHEHEAQQQQEPCQLLDKPFEDWTQEDYETYYHHEDQQQQ